MASSAHSSVRPGDVWHAAVTQPRRWLVPSLVGLILAALYSAVRTPSWQAQQALVVRDETGGNPLRPGKFSHVDDMKTVQETVLEMAKGRDVLRRALIKAGALARANGSVPNGRR